MTECSVGTDRPVVLAELDAFKAVRRSENICYRAQSEVSRDLHLGYQQLTNSFARIFATFHSSLLYVIYIKPDLPNFPMRAESNNVGYVELCNISFFERGKKLKMKLCAPNLSLLFYFTIFKHLFLNEIILFFFFDAFLGIPNCLVMKSFKTLKIFSISQDFLN